MLSSGYLVSSLNNRIKKKNVFVIFVHMSARLYVKNGIYQNKRSAVFGGRPDKSVRKLCGRQGTKLP